MAEKARLRLSSPAKLNLYLEILGKRKDGFHELCLLNTAIDLADEVEILPGGKDVRTETNHPDVPDDENNLCRRAALTFFKHLPHTRQGLLIRTNKKIPVAGGLGGGSSNAAAVLYGLDLLTGAGLSEKELQEIGAEVGSDVPFFLARSPAWVGGRGEIIEPAPSLPFSFYVIVYPDFGVSAAHAYSGWDLTRNRKKDIVEGPCSKKVPIQADEFRNDLEPLISAWHPEIHEVREALYGLGAFVAMMSGSGPTVFGIFPDEGLAEEAVRQFKVKSNKGAVVSRPLEGAIIEQLV